MSTRCFVADIQAETRLALTGDDAHHITRVLRMRVGDTLDLCDGLGHDFSGTIVAMDAATVTVMVGVRRDNAGELPVPVVLYLAVTRGERFDTALQKAVELGATELRPFLSERCVARGEGRRARWQRISLEAARQCGRGLVPEVHEAVPFAEAMAQARCLPRVFFCYEESREPIRRFFTGATHAVGLVTGPEGGFAQAEVELARSCGFPVVSLGRRILRCETAPIVALSLIGDWLENTDQ